MKIVDRKTFLTLPPGILYCKTKPCHFGDIAIKYDTWTNDWIYQSFPYFQEESDSSDAYFEAYQKLEKGESLTLDVDCAGRDGLYEEDEKFLIYEEKDIRILIEKLQTLLK